MIPQVDSKAGFPAAPGALRAQASRKAAVSTPQFSGAALTQMGNRVMQSGSRKLIPVFQNITELFIAAFLAQDLVAMVLPRIQKSLMRGRDEYDPAKDPNAKDLPFTQQMRKWVTGNVSGLNWANASEESKRELATGPGMLVIPAVAYAIARRMMGKTAVELGHAPLNAMSQGFMDHLKEAGLADAKEITPVQYRAELSKFLSKSFCDPALNTTQVGKTAQTYRQYLDDWSKRWVDGLFGAETAKGRKDALETLGEELKGKMTAFNRVARLGEDTIGQAGSGKYALEMNGVKELIERPLHRSDYAWTAFGNKPQHQPLAHLVEDLRRWGDYAETVFKEKTLNAGNASKTLHEVAEGTLKRLVNKKFLMGIGLTLVSGLYLVKVAKWAMSHDTYQANRKLQLGAAPAAGAPAATAQAPQPATAPQAAPSNGGHFA